MLLDFAKLLSSVLYHFVLAPLMWKGVSTEICQKNVFKVLIGEKGYQIVVLVYDFLIINKVQQCFIFLRFIGYHFFKETLHVFCPFFYWAFSLLVNNLLHVKTLSFICNITVANIFLFFF